MSAAGSGAAAAKNVGGEPETKGGAESKAKSGVMDLGPPMKLTTESGEPKQWFRVSNTSELHNAVMTLKSPSKSPCKISSEAAAAIESLRSERMLARYGLRACWEVELYKALGKNRNKFKVIVEYSPQVYCLINMSEGKGKGGLSKYSVSAVQAHVAYPNEFGGGGGGFDHVSLGGHHGTQDGGIKAMAAFASSSAVKAGKVHYKKKPKMAKAQKMKDGRDLYSAMGTHEIQVRAYDGTSRVQLKEGDKELVDEPQRRAIAQSFQLFVETVGETDLDSGIGRIPHGKALDVLDHSKIQLSKVVRLRVQEMARLDLKAQGKAKTLSMTDGLLECEQLVDILNRTLNEDERGGFYMTIRELQDLFLAHDVDFSGRLDTHEITKILNICGFVGTEKDEVQQKMQEIDQDNDGTMDFEEFMTLCQKMYGERGGQVVVNHGSEGRFNQTRGVITELRESVERHHLTIQHMKTQIENFDEQLEVMNTIAAQSSLQRELEKAREEKKRLGQLRDEMIQQNNGWVRDIKQIHGREKNEVNSHIKFMTGQTEEAQGNLDFVKKAYDEGYHHAMDELAEVMQSLHAVLDFTVDTAKQTGVDAQGMHGLATAAKAKMKQRQQGRKGTVFDPHLYDSSAAIHSFLQNKTSALEQWLISRTKFTQKDRERYLKRVEEVKKKRLEYEANKVELTHELDVVSKKIQEEGRKGVEAKQKNEKVRKELLQTIKREHDAAKQKELEDELTMLQEEIANGHMAKVKLSRELYPKEHALHLERHTISLLQVELGELSILLGDVLVNQDKDISEGKQIEKYTPHLVVQ